MCIRDSPCYWARNNCSSIYGPHRTTNCSFCFRRRISCVSQRYGFTSLLKRRANDRIISYSSFDCLQCPRKNGHRLGCRRRSFPSHSFGSERGPFLKGRNRFNSDCLYCIILDVRSINEISFFNSFNKTSQRIDPTSIHIRNYLDLILGGTISSQIQVLYAEQSERHTTNGTEKEK